MGMEIVRIGNGQIHLITTSVDETRTEYRKYTKSVPIEIRIAQRSMGKTIEGEEVAFKPQDAKSISMILQNLVNKQTIPRITSIPGIEVINLGGRGALITKGDQSVEIPYEDISPLSDRLENISIMYTVERFENPM